MKRAKQLGLCWIVAVLTAAGCGSGGGNGDAWERNVVEEGLEIAWGVAMAADATGAPHLLYVVSDGQSLEHARWQSGGWSKETLVSGSVETPVDLALGPGGALHAAYNNAVPSYGTDSSGSWAEEALPDGGFVDTSAAIGLDGDGSVHAAYFGPSGLQYAVKAGGAWDVSLVSEDWEQGDPHTLDLAVGPDGAPHISAMSNMGLAVYSLEGGTWAGGGIDGVNTGRCTSGCCSTFILADEGGALHLSSVASHGDGDDRVVYAERRGGAWSLEYEDFSRGDGGHFAIDGSGVVHLVYRGLSNVMYVNSLSWENEILLDEAATCISLAVDSSNRPHVSYCEFEEGTPRIERLVVAARGQ